MKTIKTVWDKRVYDVWGNAEDGYEVNDSFSDGEVKITCKVHDEGSFKYASPSDGQIKAIFGYTGKINTSGDDLTIYVDTAKGYPLGELKCISHESLSPIR
jgi:hypothetical protein